jgi:hypothetical protein
LNRRGDLHKLGIAHLRVVHRRCPWLQSKREATQLSSLTGCHTRDRRSFASVRRNSSDPSQPPGQGNQASTVWMRAHGRALTRIVLVYYYSHTDHVPIGRPPS